MIQVQLGKTDRLYGRGRSYRKAKGDAASKGLEFFGLISVSHVDVADKNGSGNGVGFDNGIDDKTTFATTTAFATTKAP